MHADSLLVSMRATGQNAVGALFVVSLPIGNDDDLSPRAAQVLQHADLVFAEDTRRVHALAQRLGTRTATTMSYHDRNEDQRAGEIVERIANGERVALVSDAGTPLLSDPGYTLVREAIARDLPVSPVPGPSAALAVRGGVGVAGARDLVRRLLAPHDGEAAVGAAAFVHERRDRRALRGAQSRCGPAQRC